MFYGGESNVPGAPGNLLAGSPGYFMSEKEIENRLFRYGMDKTPLGDQLKQRMEEIRQRYPGAFTPQAAQPSVQPGGSSNLPGAVGNMGGIANAQFFEGPQLGQAAPQGEPQKPYGGAPNIPLTPEQKAKLMQQGSPPPAEFNIQDYLRKAQAPSGLQADSLVANVPGRYPSGMEGAVDLTYPAGSPNYGKPVPNPMQSGQPLDANAAEMEIIRRLRSTPQGFQNKMVY